MLAQPPNRDSSFHPPRNHYPFFLLHFRPLSIQFYPPNLSANVHLVTILNQIHRSCTSNSPIASGGGNSIMSDAAYADADAAVAEVKPAKTPTPRKFPPPCWTQDETILLIDAYRERWYGLRRGYLRIADWEAVAEAVAARCPDASTQKTSAQCRHKVEKLRQRYRAEKQRSLSLPYPAGRFISSWFFFDYMDSMENGTPPPLTSRQPGNSDGGSQLTPHLDQNPLKLKLKTNNTGDVEFYSSVQAKRFSTDTMISNDHSHKEEVSVKEEDDTSSGDDRQNFAPKKSLYGIPIPPLKSRSKNPVGFHQDMLPHGSGTKKFENYSNDEFWAQGSNRSNAYSNSLVSSGFGEKINTQAYSKRGRDAVEDMVASIQSLAEGFIKVERAKMEMAKELESMRMEMELKRNEMILGSQKQIVDAFEKGLLDLKKNKKVKSETGKKMDLAETE